MRFTVVMPSYLGKYTGAASRRDEKIIRAINSVISQTFTDWELVVVADGCKLTREIVKTIKDDRVRAISIKKAPIWDGMPRNAGIEHGRGEYIVYLDIDDCYGENHLEIIDRNLAGHDWVHYNDYIHHSGGWVERICDMKRIGMNGTSNVCHKRELPVRWGHRGYAHDHHFNQQLLKYKNSARIETPEYFVMHIPGQYDL